jgi:2-methylisocitrate lyase-like PEP mutase family enzyme
MSAMVEAFRALHEHPPLVLPNAWDAASAVAIESAGAKAIATTSAGVSWAHGTPDGERVGRDRMLQTLAEIVEVVRVPVTADIESGYGDAHVDTVKAVIDIGIAGINIEDSPGTDGPLRHRSAQAARIEAARTTADGELWINARTDTFLAGVGTTEEQLRETMVRAQVYADAGADSLFVPGVVDLEIIRELTKGPLPINVMAGPGAPSVAALAEAGVVRVSVGPAIALAAYGLAARAAREVLDNGTYTSMADGLNELNAMVDRPRG